MKLNVSFTYKYIRFIFHSYLHLFSAKIDSFEMATAETSFTEDDFKNCIHELHSVNKVQEDKWMIRYTKIYTRELIFAVDVMSFVLQENHLRFKNFIYPNCLGIPCKSDFDEIMRTFVALTLTKYTESTQELLERNINIVQPSYTEFKAFVNSIAIGKEVFKGETFLEFCVVIAQMSALGFLYGLQKTPDFGIMLICRAYSNFEMKGLLPEDPWKVLKDAATNLILRRTLETHETVGTNM